MLDVPPDRRWSQTAGRLALFLALGLGLAMVGVASDSARTQQLALTTYVSPDGGFSLRYPPDWFVSQEGVTPGGGWFVTVSAFVSGPLIEVGRPELRLVVEPQTATPTIDGPLSHLCPAGTPEADLRCGKSEINRRIWAWAWIHASRQNGLALFRGSRNFTSATIAEGKVFQAAAVVPDGPHQGEGVRQVEAIFHTFVIR